MAKRGWMTRIPIWVRVPGIIALVLVGVLVSMMLLGAAGNGGGHRRVGDQTQMDGGGHGAGDRGSHGAGDGGGHGAGDKTQMDGGGHGSGTHGR